MSIPTPIAPRCKFAFPSDSFVGYRIIDNDAYIGDTPETIRLEKFEHFDAFFEKGGVSQASQREGTINDVENMILDVARGDHRPVGFYPRLFVRAPFSECVHNPPTG